LSINIPAELAIEAAGKVYVSAKEELIDYAVKHYGKDKGQQIRNSIESKKLIVARTLSQFAPSENQVEVLKAIELIGLGKAIQKGFSWCKGLIKNVDNIPTKTYTGVIKVGTDAGEGFKHFIELDASLLKKEINLPDDLNNRKLRAKFDAHKYDFGLSGTNFNTQNAGLFKQNMIDHINNPDTIAIAGTYRNTEAVVHYFNPITEINVMKDMNGDWISGWKLGNKQIKHLYTIGNIQ
jgi:hypothetical protein